MSKKVIFRDRQEFQAADFNNVQSYVYGTIKDIVTDAIIADKAYFTGFVVSQESTTEIRVGVGNLYKGGVVYEMEQSSMINLFQYLPVNYQRYVAIVVSNTTVETQVEPRDFLIDVVAGTTEPRAVAMQEFDTVIVSTVAGSEAAVPSYPLIPETVVPVAYVLLGTTGIVSITRVVEYELPSINYIAGELASLKAWKNGIEPKITGIATDVGALSSELKRRPTMSQVIQLALDMARVKERLEIPDDYKFYGADHYLNLDETDTTPSDYSAEVMEGVRPAPVARQNIGELSVLNPLDPTVRIYSNGFVIPAYQEYTRLAIQNYVGNVRINAYQYQSVSTVQKTITRIRIRYGEQRRVCTNSAFWVSGQYDPVSGIFRRAGETFRVDNIYWDAPNHGWVRMTQFWEDRFVEPYWETVIIETTVNGSIIGQTFLSPNTGWLTSVDLYFTEVDSGAGLTVMIAEAEGGRPNLGGVLSSVTVTAQDLGVGWRKIPLASPVLLTAGKRYAVVLVTSGSHRVGYSQGSEYTQGVLMYGQDGQYMYEDVSRDLMMRLNFAKFIAPFTVLQLSPLSLTGGIHDIDILMDGFIPDGCELYFEYQVGGVWYRIAEGTAEQLRTAPSLLPLRVVFVGTMDLQPMFRTTGSRVLVSRYGTNFKHYSTVRTLQDNTSNVIVRLLLENFDNQNHTVGCKLKIGQDEVSPNTVTVEPVDNGNIWLGGGKSYWYEYEFNLGTATTSYQIIINGNTGGNSFNVFHVAARYDLAL